MMQTVSTVGTVFKSEEVGRLANYLRDKATAERGFALDLMLNQYLAEWSKGVGTAADGTPYGGSYITLPSLVQHIGFTSSSPGKLHVRSSISAEYHERLFKTSLSFVE